MKWKCKTVLLVLAIYKCIITGKHKKHKANKNDVNLKLISIFAFRNRTQDTNLCLTVQSCENLIQGINIVEKI